MPNIWEWEDLDYFFDPKTLIITRAKSLLAPITSFCVRRTDKGDLLLDTVSTEDPDKGLLEVAAGTVRTASDTVTFVGRPEFRLPFQALATGLIYLEYKTKYNHFNGIETTQTSSIRSIHGVFQAEKEAVYTVEWIENNDSTGFIWTGASVKTEDDAVVRRTIKSKNHIVELTTKRGSYSSSNNCLRFVISGVEFYVCATERRDVAGKRQNASFILYVGDPAEPQRDKIRNVLSFCLGKYINCLGYVTLDEAYQAISVKALAVERFGRDAAIYPALPPAPLFKSYKNEVHQDVINIVVNAIFQKYDELDFSKLTWAYWHALIAPVHMAAVHYGAALETLRRSCALSMKLGTTLLPDNQWQSLKLDLLQRLSHEELDESLQKIFSNKISNLNQLPNDRAMDDLLMNLGLGLGTLERRAWRRRNVAAHGAQIKKEDFVVTIRETKVLRIMIHRIVLAFTGASEYYYDYYSLNFPIRNVTDPIPID